MVLDLIVIDDTPESHRLMLDHYNSAIIAADRVAPLLAINRSSAAERREVLEQTYHEWHSHISGYSNYLRIVSSGTCSDVFEMIEAEKNGLPLTSSSPHGRGRFSYLWLSTTRWFGATQV